MKKLINLAVAAIMMTLCTVILGACSGSEIEGDQPVRPVDPTVHEVLRNNCTENVVNTYTSDNAEIKTRSVVVPQGNYEALISAKSVHQFIVDILYKEDVPVKQDSVAYTVTNTVKPGKKNQKLWKTAALSALTPLTVNKAAKSSSSQPLMNRLAQTSLSPFREQRLKTSAKTTGPTANWSKWNLFIWSRIPQTTSGIV